MSVDEILEQHKSGAAKMDRMGSRGAAKQNMDELPLQIQDVDLVPSRPSDMKELYFWYYPSDVLQWPFFHRRLWNWNNWDWAGIERAWNPKKWSISCLNPLAHFEEWKEQGPKALALWNRRVKNDHLNFEGMSEMARYQRFPEYIWEGKQLAIRRPFRHPIKTWMDWKQRNDTFSDLSAGELSPLRRILLDAADVYVAMNAAVSEGNRSNLASYAGGSYLTELETRARRIGDCRKLDNPVTYEWEFGHWVNPPQCLSIRTMDFFAGHSKAYLTGERLYANMLVKFESVQTMTITESFRNGPLGELQHREPEVHQKEVTEYMILDVRTWIPGRRPKFIREVFEGQELKVHVQRLDSLKSDKKPATAEDASESTEVTAAT